jgi:hypothetical protein
MLPPAALYHHFIKHNNVCASLAFSGCHNNIPHAEQFTKQKKKKKEKKEKRKDRFFLKCIFSQS